MGCTEGGSRQICLGVSQLDVIHADRSKQDPKVRAEASRSPWGIEYEPNLLKELFEPMKANYATPTWMRLALVLAVLDLVPPLNFPEEKTAFNSVQAKAS